MKIELNKIIILSSLIYLIIGFSVEAKEQICGNLASIVYYPQSDPPKMGCLYAYNTYGQTPFWLQVKQVVNGGILVSADDAGIYHYGFYNPKDIYIQTSKQFVDGQILKDKEIVKYTGYYDYITVLGARKRVYKFYRYGKYEIEKNVDKTSLEKFGFISPQKTSYIKDTTLKNNADKAKIEKYFKQLKVDEEKFKKNAEPKPLISNNFLFKKFKDSYLDYIDILNNNTVPTAVMPNLPDDKLKQYFETNYNISIASGEGILYFVPDYNYLYNNFKNYITPQYIEWLQFLDKTSNDFVEVYPAIDLKTITDRILYLDKFLENNPSFIEKENVENERLIYLNCYLGNIEGGNLYVEDSGKLKYEYRKSLEDFLKNHKNTKSYSEIKAYYTKVKKNNFKEIRN